MKVERGRGVKLGRDRKMTKEGQPKLGKKMP